MENPGIDPGTSRMQIERSTIWANSPMNGICGCYQKKTYSLFSIDCHFSLLVLEMVSSRVAQRKRAGPITQRSVDRNHPLLRHSFTTETEKTKKDNIFPNHSRARPGVEPGTSRTRSANHTTRPTSQACFKSQTVPASVYTTDSSVGRAGDCSRLSQISLGHWFKSGSVELILCAASIVA